MSAWHVDDTVAIAYGTRRLDAVQRASVEAHAVRCEDCRAVLAASATGDHGRTDLDLDLDQLWTRIEAAISAPELGRGGQALLRLGASMSDVVVTRFVAAQSRQWTIATTLVLAVTAVAAVLGPVDSAHAAFLIVAPLLPALGVAATYRLVPHGIDLLERAAPFSPARMLLWRTAYVVFTAVAAVLGPVDSAHAAFLVVAPLLPALGVAATYRLVPHGIDLLERAAPFSPARMLLWRTAYVVVTAVPVAVAVGAMVLHHPGAAVSWLLPALACTLCVAAAATWHDPVRPAALVALGWTAVVVAWQVRDTPWAVTTAPTQLVAIAVSVGAALLLHHRLSSDPAPSAVSST